MRPLLACLALLLLPPSLWGQVDWRTRVSAQEKARTNPVAGQSAAAEAGSGTYKASCAKCHGDDANGTTGRPGLRTDRVADETDGEIFWILQNGVRWRGMPAWAGLGDDKLWQLVTYLRTLRPEHATPGSAPSR